MNTPNKLTLTRIALVPVMTVFLLNTGIPMSYLLAGIVFTIASLTDYYDGKLARKNNLITDFGKLLDPVADKILVAAAFICFIEKGLTSSWVLIIVLLREFLVTSIRMVSAGRGIVIPANMWGKCKTVSQIIAIAVVLTLQFALQLFHQGFITPWFDITVLETAFNIIGRVAVWISTVLTFVSGAVYIWGARELFKDIK